MRWIFIILLTIFTSCNSHETLSRFCPYECYAVPGVSEGIFEVYNKNQIGVGQCKAGIPVCDENFNIIECNGEVLPKSEICDDIDNNCNGKTDESYEDEPLSLFPQGNDCFKSGVCRGTFAECERGEYVCKYPDDYEQTEISCDGKDNDCDGLIDEVEAQCTDLLGNPISCTCYEGPIGTEQYGDCDNGFYQCTYGSWQCINQILPSIELCDFIDNDCNGIIDDTGEILEADYDIVFIIDNSGSMCNEIEAVGTALSTYVDQFEGNEFFRFALVLMTHIPNPRVTIDVPFGDLAAIRDRLLLMGCNGKASEASLDSMDMVCDIEDPLNLEWREDVNKLFFAFTDENAQSYSNPETTTQDVIDKCLESWTLPFIWGQYPLDFSRICSNANGLYFLLVDHWQTIFDDLNSIIEALCGSSQ